MAELTKDELLDARHIEVARLKSRAERAEDAVGRVLALCTKSTALSSADVMAAIQGTRT